MEIPTHPVQVRHRTLIAFLYAATFPQEEWRARVDEALRGMEGI